jgi:radical SAM superfamily enzyme YgiQ (UPF0313 family)
MRVLLVNPPEKKTIQANLPGAVEKLRGATPPISLMCVAAAVRAGGRHEAGLLDAFALDLDYGALEKRIRGIAPDVVGIPVTTFTLLDAMETARRVRRAVPEARIVAGGIQPSIYPAQTAGLEAFDYCFAGEVDLTLPRFLEALEGGGPLDGMPGIVYMAEDRLVSNPPAAPADDLDALPFPAHDLLEIDRYSSLVTDLEPVSITITSRGCPYRCSFCSRSVTGKKYRTRSPESIAEEMAWCEKLGIRYMLIYDEVMTIKKDRVLALCELLLKKGTTIKWMARTKVGSLTEEMLSAMKRAGCDLVTMGIESGSPGVLKRLNRPTDTEALIESFHMIHRAGLKSIAYFMVGCPGEEMADLRASLDVARRANPDMVHAAVFVPYPATDLYEEGLATGRFDSDYWEAFSRHPTEAFHPRLWVEPGREAEMMQRLAWFYRRFYLRPGYVLRRLKQLKGRKDLGRNLRGLATLLSGKSWPKENPPAAHE